MAYDAESYLDNLPDTRLRQLLKRRGKLKAGSKGGTTGRGSATLRSPRRKKGKYFAA